MTAGRNPETGIAWPPGEWDTETDREVWRDTVTGLPCLIRRNMMFGNWCGYVAVPLGHPLHGAGLHDAPLNPHGGITFTGGCDGDREHGVCHVPEPGEPDNVWWFGFDCGHCMDIIPAMLSHGLKPFMHSEYRNTEFVKKECARLALQLEFFGDVQQGAERVKWVLESMKSEDD